MINQSNIDALRTARHLLLTTPFNPEFLRMARYLRAVAQAELAECTGIVQGIISKYEAGIKVPTAEHLVLFARALVFPIDFFFREGRMLPPLADCHYREVQADFS